MCLIPFVLGSVGHVLRRQIVETGLRRCLSRIIFFVSPFISSSRLLHSSKNLDRAIRVMTIQTTHNT